MTASVFDPRICQLGEGPMWHPQRQQLFWFDILGSRLMTVKDGAPKHWQFDENVSAAGWVDRDRLLVASETALLLFDLETGSHEIVTPMEADNPVTRSNDGRADPWGGFWIGTMGKAAEKEAGAIYRWYGGHLEKLYDKITIPNAICFAPDRSCAYFTDTLSGQIMRQTLDDNGWPEGAPQVFVDLRSERLNPDGAVVDAAGCLWNAQWGAGRVARYAPDGTFMSAVDFPASQLSCPAFGGDDLTTLFATSAQVDLAAPTPGDGQTFTVTAEVTGHITGQQEHQVIL